MGTMVDLTYVPKFLGTLPFKKSSPSLKHGLDLVTTSNKQNKVEVMVCDSRDLVTKGTVTSSWLSWITLSGDVCHVMRTGPHGKELRSLANGQQVAEGSCQQPL